MNITLTASEIEEAVKKYIKDKLSVPEDKIIRVVSGPQLRVAASTIRIEIEELSKISSSCPL